MICEYPQAIIESSDLSITKWRQTKNIWYLCRQFVLQCYAKEKIIKKKFIFDVKCNIIESIV